jgi:hypothetical protein
LYVIVDNPRESAITLNNDIATIHAWSTKWLVNFKPKKTETMTITRKINKPFHPPLIMNNTIINQVTEHKHFGVEISNDGSWQTHIDLITKKYADVVWDNKILFLITKLENVQIEAARIVTGGTRLVSINSLYKETGWETPQARREHHKYIYFHKMVNGLVPSYFSAIVPCNFENIHDYNTRQAVSIPPVRTRTTLYNNYFLPSTVRFTQILL